MRGRDEQSFVRLFERDRLDLESDPQLLNVWIYLLTHVSHQDQTVVWAGKGRLMPAGSIVLASRDLARIFGASAPSILRRLQYLEETGRISIETKPGRIQGSIITIRDWKRYFGHAESLPQNVQNSSSVLTDSAHTDAVAETRSKTQGSEQESRSTIGFQGGVQQVQNTGLNWFKFSQSSQPLDKRVA